jgi:hypothetical protein
MRVTARHFTAITGVVGKLSKKSKIRLTAALFILGLLISMMPIRYGPVAIGNVWISLNF